MVLCTLVTADLPGGGDRMSGLWGCLLGTFPAAPPCTTSLQGCEMSCKRCRGEVVVTNNPFCCTVPPELDLQGGCPGWCLAVAQPPLHRLVHLLTQALLTKTRKRLPQQLKNCPVGGMNKGLPWPGRSPGWIFFGKITVNRGGSEGVKWWMPGICPGSEPSPWPPLPARLGRHNCVSLRVRRLSPHHKQ